jgi:hypothetical protein
MPSPTLNTIVNRVTATQALTDDSGTGPLI